MRLLLPYATTAQASDRYITTTYFPSPRDSLIFFSTGSNFTITRITASIFLFTYPRANIGQLRRLTIPQPLYPVTHNLDALRHVFFLYRIARLIPPAAHLQTSALKPPATTCKEAEDSLQVSVGRRAPKPRARASARHAKERRQKLLNFAKRHTRKGGRPTIYSTIISASSSSESDSNSARSTTSSSSAEEREDARALPLPPPTTTDSAQTSPTKPV